jgi:hypothetical protein
MSLRVLASIDGRLGITETSAITILDQEAKAADRDAIKLTRESVKAHTPVGPGRGGKHLRDQYRFNVVRTAYGYVAQLRRTSDGWYGRIVENGRHAGVSASGRHYPAATANPHVERGAAAAHGPALIRLEGGAERAAKRIQAEVID